MRSMLTIRNGFIYFIRMDKIGPIKVGFAKNVIERIVQLQTGNPYQLNILAYYAGNENDEKQIQYLLRDSNIRGEWFHPTEKVLQYVDMAKEMQAKDDIDTAKGNNIFGDFRLESDFWDKIGGMN